MEEKKNRKHSHCIMTKNVTQFRHLIKSPHATENDVTWAINLRQYCRSPTKVCKDGTAPEVYHKKTKISQIRQQQLLKSKSNGFLPFKYSQFSHMVPKFNQKTVKQSSTAIQFFSSLRKDDKYQDEQNIHKFTSVPFKDRHQTPKILKKANMKKTNNFLEDDFETTEDGWQKYPQYSQKILRTQNFGLLKSFTSVNGRGKVTLPGLAWQIGLRNY